MSDRQYTARKRLMRHGIDKGFCARWGRLSYRRKFIRTLWAAPVMLALLFLVVPEERKMLGIQRDSVAIISALGFLYQAISNYRKWTNEKRARNRIAELLRNASPSNSAKKQHDSGIKSFADLEIRDVFANNQDLGHKDNS